MISPRCFCTRFGRLEKAAVIVVRHEADFHAFLLVGGLELAMARHGAGVALGLFAQRKQGARQLVLPQRKQEIALVLAQIASALEQIAGEPSAALFHARKMAGGDVIRAQAGPPGSMSRPNLRFWLHITHGLGVRPALYSSAKYWMTCF